MTAGPPTPAPAACDRGPDPARGSAVPAGPRSPAPAGLFRAFIVRSLRQQPLRSAATIASLAVGVAVVVAIQLANVSSVRGFSTALDALAGRTSLELAVPGVGLDETRLAALGWLREYGLVSPVIDADVLLEVTPDGAAPALEAEVGLGAGQGPAEVTADGAPVLEAVRLLGVDILRDRPFRDYPLVAGDEPRPVTTQDFLDLLTDPRAVVLTRPFTRRHGLAVGDGVTLVAGDRTTRLRVAGILGDEGPARALDGNFALMDVAAAQWALDRLGRLDRVDLRLADGVDVARAEAAIAARLPAGITVRRPSSRGAEVERMLRAFQFNLTALSLIALLVGLFLVYNTVSVSVITRRSEIGLLRTLGVTRRAGRRALPGRGGRAGGARLRARRAARLAGGARRGPADLVDRQPVLDRLVGHGAAAGAAAGGAGVRGRPGRSPWPPRPPRPWRRRASPRWPRCAATTTWTRGRGCPGAGSPARRRCSPPGPGARRRMRSAACPSSACWPPWPSCSGPERRCRRCSSASGGRAARRWRAGWAWRAAWPTPTSAARFRGSPYPSPRWPSASP